MENNEVFIPDAPVEADETVKAMYRPPLIPKYGDYSRIRFSKSTGNLVKDKYVKSKTVAFVLHLFFGIWGIGDLYCGRAGRALLKFFTAGGFFVWALIDAFKVLMGKYDTDGKCFLL